MTNSIGAFRRCPNVTAVKVDWNMEELAEKDLLRERFPVIHPELQLESHFKTLPQTNAQISSSNVKLVATLCIFMQHILKTEKCRRQLL